MWGTCESYKKLFNSVLNNLPSNAVNVLHPTKYCKYNNKIWIELEDNIYCPKCGDKSLFFAYACLGLLCDRCR